MQGPQYGTGVAFFVPTEPINHIRSCDTWLEQMYVRINGRETLLNTLDPKNEEAPTEEAQPSTATAEEETSVSTAALVNRKDHKHDGSAASIYPSALKPL